MEKVRYPFTVVRSPLSVVGGPRSFIRYSLSAVGRPQSLSQLSLYDKCYARRNKIDTVASPMPTMRVLLSFSL